MSILSLIIPKTRLLFVDP